MTAVGFEIGRLAWAQLWQVTLVAVGVAFVTGLFCRRRPHLAYMLWMLVLAKSLTPPVWTSPTGLFRWSAVAFAPPSLERTSDGFVSRGFLSQDEMRRSYGPRGNLSLAGEEPASGEAAASLSGSRESAPATVALAGPALSIATVLGLAWLTGAALCAGFILISTLRLRRTIINSQGPVDAALVSLAKRLRGTLRIRRPARLVVTEKLIGPLAFGWFRPIVVLPEKLVLSHSPDELEPFLAHELVHVRRNDALVALLQSVVQCLWWFHPLIWWANRRIVEERERCCDEAVIAGLGCRPGQYARSLLNVLEWKWQARWVAPIPAIRAFEVNKRRLEHLMSHPGRFRDALSGKDWLFLVVGLLLVIPGAVPAPAIQSAAATSVQPAAANDLLVQPAASENRDKSVAEPPQAPAEAVQTVQVDAAVANDQTPRGPLIEIYAMNVDGTNARRVAGIPGFPIINSPEISPDGKWVAVDGWTWDQKTPDAVLLIVNLETGLVKNLGMGAMPSWSADGLWIAYSKYEPEGGVFIREVDGSAERLIDRNGWGIQWAPDGFKLAYERGGNLIVYDLRSNEGREVFPQGTTPYQYIYWNCKWSPDSKRVCFKGRRFDKTVDIAIVSTIDAGPNLRVVCDGQDYNEDIGWHPNGSRVTIPRKVMPDRLGQIHHGQIYEFDPDRDAPPKLLAGQPADRNNGGMCFSPDGKTFIFMSYK
ncbi:MAG TPA: M56 family metallopeptidase [Planctomycetaceae bacterium]|nr:M56 family metallopeptidase [Planctomycetaceae bacterium]